MAMRRWPGRRARFLTVVRHTIYRSPHHHGV